MANRPVFVISDTIPFYREEKISFEFFSGFADVQKQKSIQSLHTEFGKAHPAHRVLEISTKSQNPLGVALSAFNLAVTHESGFRSSLESAFQGAKVFETGGPYKELFHEPPWVAKKDARLKNGGSITGFAFGAHIFPTEPKTFFYDWLYINAIQQSKDLSRSILEYDAFTDIEFNPKKSINCQARSAAIYVSLFSAGQLEEALISPNQFRLIVYGAKPDSSTADTPRQLSLF